MKYFLFFLFFPFIIHSIDFNSPEAGRILFLIQKGDHAKGLELYREYTQDGDQNYELLHRIGLGIVEYGFQQPDPETQLLALFGASISLHDEAYHILEDSLSSKHPQIQLVALNALARVRHDGADQAIASALSSPHLVVRMQAAYQLCLKKHPQAMAQTESLMYKTPKTMLAIYPPFFASIGDDRSIRMLRRLLNNSDEKVRIATILSIAQFNRDDLLPQVRQQATHHHYAQQEASAYTLGHLKDEKSIPQLKRLSDSQYPHVALAAQYALYRLGNQDDVKEIEAAAKNGNVFAITTLGEIPESTSTLLELMKNPNVQVRLNAMVALLELRNLACYSALPNFLIQTRHNLAFAELTSPGQSLTAWKAIPSSSQVLKDDIPAYMTNIKFKEEMLEKAKELSEPDFLKLADALFAANQTDLVPMVAQLLEEFGNEEAIQILKKHQQKIGSPLVRNYCNLALYRLKETGPYGDLLRQWVKSQYHNTLIQFRPFDPWALREKSFELTPEETSRLLVESFEAFANQQDEPGIEMLLQAIQNGNEKNKYALAGLLIRATQ